MRYLLVNVSSGNLQIDLFNPTTPYNRRKMHMMGPAVSFNITRGETIDALPFFNGSLEKTHAAIKHSRDILQLLKPTQLYIRVVDDLGNDVDVDKLFKEEGSAEPVIDLVEEVKSNPDDEDTGPIDLPPSDRDPTMPDMGVSAALAIQDQAAAVEAGEANEPLFYTRYKEEDLDAMTKEQLLGIANKLKLQLSKRTSNKEIIATILGAQ